jgi:ABC-type branched-subunit amino acid transport system substrate-binding protein
MAGRRDAVLKRWLTRRHMVSVLGVGAAALASACSGIGNLGGDLVSSSANPPPDGALTPEGTPGAPGTIGQGQTKIALILPMSAPGNAGAAGQSMRNAAEMAFADFNNPDVQLIIKDDAGTTQGAQTAARQAIEEGAQVILGPLFAGAVAAVAPIARAGGVPVIAFSTDSNVATRGVFLLSFLPESDVERVVSFAASQGRHSFAALVPDNAYGSTVEAAFRQIVPTKGGRVVAIARYRPGDADMQGAIRQIAQAAAGADALFIPDSGDAVPQVAKQLAAAGVDMKRLQVLGTGLWDDPRIFSDTTLEGSWFAGPDSSGYKAFVTRYRSKYGQEPARTATLAYDAVALMIALAKAAPGQRITAAMLTNPSGFSGIDGVFRFRVDGTNERGLAVHKVTPSGGEVISGAPKSFG